MGLASSAHFGGQGLSLKLRAETGPGIQNEPGPGIQNEPDPEAILLLGVDLGKGPPRWAPVDRRKFIRKQ